MARRGAGMRRGLQRSAGIPSAGFATKESPVRSVERGPVNCHAALRDRVGARWGTALHMGTRFAGKTFRSQLVVKCPPSAPSDCSGAHGTRSHSSVGLRDLHAHTEAVTASEGRVARQMAGLRCLRFDSLSALASHSRRFPLHRRRCRPVTTRRELSPLPAGRIRYKDRSQLA
ncbi:uncharacterized protein CC84DRAFT_733380 [Paraphaeosphaeria sporulosa]|uniref:Uncharacterized protein n=1 Tax=Paraphaeosphaeria sporulosa TaxID=1460663 RepID=A0A177CEW9_9PLEO|nr:uncharacterized protein CC84DRAFT_733380 [Paraphaeosphaeria sporulosa]OAG05751.1 hypothetical protein CC84DRAFT_733380 [Paraphaeosphaeria sporulosa]